MGQDRRCAPQFSKVSKTKVIDRNKKIKNTVKIRAAQFEELRELWTEINKRYIIFFDSAVDKLIEDELPNIISEGVFGYQTISSERQLLDTSSGLAETRTASGVQYVLSGRKIPYNEFLTRANRMTNIPITTIHKAIQEYANSNDFENSYINESSLTRFIQKFNEEFIIFFNNLQFFIIINCYTNIGLKYEASKLVCGNLMRGC